MQRGSRRVLAVGVGHLEGCVRQLSIHLAIFFMALDRTPVLPVTTAAQGSRQTQLAARACCHSGAGRQSGASAQPRPERVSWTAHQHVYQRNKAFEATKSIGRSRPRPLQASTLCCTLQAGRLPTTLGRCTTLPACGMLIERFISNQHPQSRDTAAARCGNARGLASASGQPPAGHSGSGPPIAQAAFKGR